MHSFVVRIALRQHVPLRTYVENPQYRFQHMTGRDRLASSTPIGNMLLRKMLPNALPLFVRQPNHSSFIADRQQSGILRWVLEPISKSSEEDNEAGELDKAEEVLSVVLPADEDATLPLYPGEEALDEPAPLVTA